MAPGRHQVIRALLLFLLVPLSVQAQPAPTSAATVLNSLTYDEFAALEAEIAPLVEKTCGRKFKQLPELELATAETISALFKKKMTVHLRNTCPGCSPWDIDQSVNAYISTYARQLAGYYDYESGRLYLLPENLVHAMGMATFDRTRYEMIYKLIIAHELTHALQDQEVGLKRMAALTDPNEMWAFESTIEGHASFIEGKVAGMIGLDPALAGSMGTDIARDPMGVGVIYDSGRRFIAYHYERGGNALLWEILALPPLNVSMIENPASYRPLRRPASRLNRLFDDLAGSRYFSDWKVRRAGLIMSDPESAYTGLTREDEARLFSCLLDTRSLRAENEKTSSTLRLDFFLARSSEDALAVAYLLEDTWQNIFNDLQRGQLDEWTSFSVMNIPQLKADRARRMSITYAKGKNPSRDSLQALWIVRGNMIIEFVADRFPLPDKAIWDIVDSLFLRYDQLK